MKSAGGDAVMGGGRVVDESAAVLKGEVVRVVVVVDELAAVVSGKVARGGVCPRGGGGHPLSASRKRGGSGPGKTVSKVLALTVLF